MSKLTRRRSLLGITDAEQASRPCVEIVLVVQALKDCFGVDICGVLRHVRLEQAKVDFIHM